MESKVCLPSRHASGDLRQVVGEHAVAGPRAGAGERVHAGLTRRHM